MNSLVEGKKFGQLSSSTKHKFFSEVKFSLVADKFSRGGGWGGSLVD